MSAQIEEAIRRVFARRGSERDYRDAIRAVMGGTATSSRAATIARTELATLYGRANLEAVRDLEAQSPGEKPLLLKVVEVRDWRNHPLSRVIQGHIRHPSEPIKASAAAVALEAARMGWSAKRIVKWLDASILWTREGDTYVGQHHPGHYNDRGREVPWRERWGGKRADTSPEALTAREASDAEQGLHLARELVAERGELPRESRGAASHYSVYEQGTAINAALR